MDSVTETYQKWYQWTIGEAEKARLEGAADLSSEDSATSVKDKLDSIMSELHMSTMRMSSEEELRLFFAGNQEFFTNATKSIVGANVNEQRTREIGEGLFQMTMCQWKHMQAASMSLSTPVKNMDKLPEKSQEVQHDKQPEQPPQQETALLMMMTLIREMNQQQQAQLEVQKQAVQYQQRANEREEEAFRTKTNFCERVAALPEELRIPKFNKVYKGTFEEVSTRDLYR